MLTLSPITDAQGLVRGFVLATGLIAAAAWAAPASARDINLGGQNVETRHSYSTNETKAQIPETAIALPRVVASVHNRVTGRWQRVLVDAYIEPKDKATLGQMRDLVKDIVAKMRPQLQSRPAEFLESAHSGTREAKDCIRQASEESLGHSWDGNIYIKSLAVF